MRKKNQNNKTLYAILFRSIENQISFDPDSVWASACELIYVNLSKVIHRMKPFVVWPSIMYYCLVPAAAYATTVGAAAAASVASACEEIFRSIPDAYGERVCGRMPIP